MAEYQVSSDQEIQISHLLSTEQLEQERQDGWLSHLAFFMTTITAKLWHNKETNK